MNTQFNILIEKTKKTLIIMTNEM